MKRIKYFLSLTILISINQVALSQWSLTGNSGTTYPTNFIGTTDNKSMRFRTNNTQRMILDSLGNVSITGSITGTGYYYGATTSPLSIELQRALPTTVGNYIEIGSFDAGANVYGHAFRISITAGAGGLSLSKSYVVSVTYTGPGTYTITPVSESGPFSGNNFELVIITVSGDPQLRILRTAGTTSSTARVRIESTGDTQDIFTASSGTGSMSTPAPYADVYQRAFGTVLNGLEASYTFSNWGSVGSIPLVLITPTTNGGSSPSATFPALSLVRNGVDAQAYSNIAEFKIGRFAGTGTGAHTQLDIALTHGDNATSGTTVMSLLSAGNVGIGTTTPNANAKLDVNGNIFSSGVIAIGTTNVADTNYKLFVEKGVHTRKVRVDQSTWADYVFYPEYNLRPLYEVEKFIQRNNHLPEVPSAKEVEEIGIDLGDNQSLLLKKIEELTLYIIDQDKKMEQLRKDVETLKKHQQANKS
jgi:hypothetical protein